MRACVSVCVCVCVEAYDTRAHTHKTWSMLLVAKLDGGKSFI
jgi:hypothetical protein